MSDTPKKIEPKPLEEKDIFPSHGFGLIIESHTSVEKIRSALEWITEMEEQRLRLLKSENRNQFQEGYFAAMMVCKKLRSKAFAAVMK